MIKYIMLATIIVSSMLYSQWNKVDGITEEIHSLGVYSDSVWWFSSTNTVYKTLNSGESWVKISRGGVSFILEDSLWWNGKLYSTDAGVTWKTSNTPSPIAEGPVVIENVNFVNKYEGWATGYEMQGRQIKTRIGGVILKTPDGGKSYARAPKSSSYPGSIYLKDYKNGWIAGSPTAFQLRNDSLLNISLGVLNTYTTLSAVSIIKDSMVIGVGYGGGYSYFFLSINGGTTWKYDTLPFTQFALDCYFCSKDSGWIATSKGIYFTETAGKVWSKQNDYNISKIRFSKNGIGWAIGPSGLYKTTNGGVTHSDPIHTYIPQVFTLFQNYPNPFNPTTNIQFSISKGDFVTIEVYDILGNVIDLLCKEYRDAGVYNLLWDANKYSSGIYFYKIQTSEYSSSKKMLLVK